MSHFQNALSSIVLGLFLATSAGASAAETARESQPGYLELTSEDLSGLTLVRIDEWLYRGGDEASWADPDLDDSNWLWADSEELPARPVDTVWPGIGWFRVHLLVEPAIADQDLALTIFQDGASEIYLDGELIVATGEVSASPDREVARFDRDSPIVFRLEGRQEALLAVRFSNHSNPPALFDLGGGGIQVYVSTLATGIERRLERQRFVLGVLLLFAALPMTLSLIHLFAFVFDRSRRAHLYFAILTALIAALSLIEAAPEFIETPSQGVLLMRFFPPTAVLLLLSGVATIYSLYADRFPMPFYFLLVIGSLVALIGAVSPSQGVYLALTFVAILFCAEWLRAIAVATMALGRRVLPVAFGVIAFVAALLYQQAFNWKIVSQTFWLPPYFMGLLVLLLCLSLQLAYTMARTSRNLEQQLVQVQDLSDKALEQERQAHERLVAQRLLEAENARKSTELEEGRRLQLSMLPQEVPLPDHLDIAVHMRTATEVGGDYYDFMEGEDGSLTIAIGDATGHGLTAGIMVTAAKVLFQSSSPDADLKGLMSRFAETIRGLHLEHLYMALTLVRIRGFEVEVVAAGMPPVLVYRSETAAVEEVAMPGMPLGSWVDYPYEQRRLRLVPGDALLLMSDGLAEWTDPAGEMIGYPWIQDRFAETAAGRPEEVIADFIDAARKRSVDSRAQDDVTLLAIKAREAAG